jgi:hypothetical protein
LGVPTKTVTVLIEQSKSQRDPEGPGERMRPVRPTMTYVGIAIAAAGFVVIMYTWGEVAALTAVPLQLPYLVSGGLVGLGLILTGLTLVNINAKRQDAAARERQLGQVREVLTEVKALLAGDAGAATAESAPPAADPTEPIPPVNVT